MNELTKDEIEEELERLRIREAEAEEKEKIHSSTETIKDLYFVRGQIHNCYWVWDRLQR